SARNLTYTVFPSTTLFRSSILSDQFLEDVKALPQKNVAIQLLERLLKGEVKYLMRTNATKSKKFSEMAKDIERAQKEGEELGLKDRKSTRLNSSHVSISYA